MRATKPPAWTGRGLRTQPALGSSALSLPKLSKLPSSEAVCLQLDGSSASPACLLCFLILGVGLSKSRAEPPWDQGEAGGPPVPSSFFVVVGVFFPLYFFSSFFALHTKLGYDETPVLPCSQHSCTAHAGNNCPWWSSANCRAI